MINTMLVRLKIETPLGSHYLKTDEINIWQYKDYVEEITLDTIKENGVATFSDENDNTVFIMPGTMKNSVLIVERMERQTDE